MKYLLDGEATSRLIFRFIEPSDFSSWLPFFESPVTHLHWKVKDESPLVACKRWYERQQERYTCDLGGMNVLVEKGSGVLVGHCGLLIQSVDDIQELEIGYSLLPAFWGRGYAIEAAAHCKEVAFRNEYSESLISIISRTNHPSQRVAYKNGMMPEKETVYHENDVIIFRVKREAWLPGR